MKRDDPRTRCLAGYVAGIEIRPALMNAAGVFPYISELVRHKDHFGALVTKSTGESPREGNETPIIAYAGNSAWVNAVGLSNPGCEETGRELGEFYPLDIPVIDSVFGHSEDELVYVVRKHDPYCDMFELNFSCPNIKKGEKTGMQIGRDEGLVRSYTQAVVQSTKKPVIVKPPPSVYIDDREKAIRIARAAVDAGAKAISGINTIPGGIVININARRPVLSATYGGVSGPGIKPVGLGFIYTMREEFGDDVSLIGMGGVENARDVVEYVMAGADAVAIGTGFLNINRGESFDDYLDYLLHKLHELVTWELGANNLMELKGAAHGKR